jgi:hypothetical protein
MKYLKIMVAIALAFAMTSIAYAETQSVKVSGDITERGFVRNNYGLNHDDAGAAVGSRSSSWDTFLQSTAEVEVDADLTDNVSGAIRVVNQKVWGNGGYAATAAERLGSINAPYTDEFSAFATAPGTNAFDVELSLAYIELKEFLYSPLTLKIGKQNLWFGKGFIIGANLQDNQGNLFAPEYTAVKSFDAVRATLDYAPWTIDAIAAKIGENYMRADDDVNLFGLNAGYVFDAYNAEVEGYWFMKQQRYSGTSGIATQLLSVHNGTDSNDVHTFGLRGSFDPLEDWTIFAEGAYQAGNYIGINNQNEDRARSAWAVDAGIECRYFQKNFAWRPVLNGEYIFYSGEENLGAKTVGTNGDYHGWDPMYRGKFDSAIREWQNVYYGTAMASSPAWTNQHQVKVKGSIEPTDSLTCSAQYSAFWLAEAWAENSGVTAGGTVCPENNKKFVGQEVDLETTWDYTEDVTFGLLAAWFFPGEHFSSGAGNDVATDLVGSVKLSF